MLGGGCNDDYEFDEFGGISCFSIRVDMEVEVRKGEQQQTAMIINNVKIINR